jgi:hypothetical protein
MASGSAESSSSVISAPTTTPAAFSVAARSSTPPCSWIAERVREGTAAMRSTTPEPARTASAAIPEKPPFWASSRIARRATSPDRGSPNFTLRTSALPPQVFPRSATSTRTTGRPTRSGSSVSSGSVSSPTSSTGTKADEAARSAGDGSSAAAERVTSVASAPARARARAARARKLSVIRIRAATSGLRRGYR